MQEVSIHTPRVGRDISFMVMPLATSGFNPHAPCGARPSFANMPISRFMFQSTRPVWGATGRHGKHCAPQKVSIHTPRVGRDRGAKAPVDLKEGFNPHAPCGARPTGLTRHRRRFCFNPHAPCGARLRTRFSMPFSIEFQSTRPVWGATILVIVHAPANQFQSTRPVWGATIPLHSVARQSRFQSTRPVWGAT